MCSCFTKGMEVQGRKRKINKIGRDQKFYKRKHGKSKRTRKDL